MRRSLLEFPWPRLYEHPWMNCSLAIERTYQGEEGVFVGIFRAPEHQTSDPAPAGRLVVQERVAGKSRLLSHGLAIQPCPHAVAAATLVEHAEYLGLQAVQAVRHLRFIELRRTRSRANSPHLAAHDHPDLRPDRPDHWPCRRQVDLRPPRARRRVYRTQTTRHRRCHERPDPDRAAWTIAPAPDRSLPRNHRSTSSPS